MTTIPSHRLVLAALAALSLSETAEARALGRCGFDTEQLSFAGSPAEQARCLLAPVLRGGSLGQGRSLAAPLASLIGTPAMIDSDKLKTMLIEQGQHGLAASLGQHVSSTGAGVRARYFVIHDTSQKLQGTRFPDNAAAEVNGLGFKKKGQYVAHLFINRRGKVLVGHDLGVPWRATQLELAAGVRTRGLFLHVEHNQPRLGDPRVRAENDRIAPEPGFTPEQYKSSALMYVVASKRAGRWLIPAFHAVIDAGVVAGGHDDPQNFDLAAWSAAVTQLAEQLK